MKAPTLSSIRAKAFKVVREIDQIMNDQQHWNNTHPDETPLNIDHDGKMAQTRKEAIATIKWANIQMLKGKK